MDKHKVYFPNLNGLRFIAVMLVIVFHIEGYKSLFKMQDSRISVPFIALSGPIGVIFFFVLSGFLITYLLLSEENLFQEINIGKFYTRRMLRIWPLYFLILVLAFFILPNIDIFILPGYGKDAIYSNLVWKILLYVLLFPNLACVMLSAVPYATHIWSIGTEEQFYLAWPLLLRYIKRRRRLLMAVIIIAYVAIAILLNSHYTDGLWRRDVMRGFWSRFNIDCMAIGGIFALLYFQKSKFLKVFQNTTLFYCTVALVLLLFGMGFHFRYFHNEVYGLLFGIIILNFATNHTIKISLEYKVLHYLGRISYGLYMYHPIAIILAFAICRGINLSTNWVIYPLAVLLTIGFAALSYHYFEAFFLKFKKKFSNIKSGDKAKATPVV
jgi:peptidoglycan/LPS O-acetylase OafA/YrhL